MPNSWNGSGDQERWRPERSKAADSGLGRADLWGDSKAAAEENELHVLELLQRLEGENETAAEAKAKMVEEPAKQPSTKWAQWEPDVSCPACAYVNSSDQRFCGYCGSSLQQRNDAATVEELYPETTGAEETRQSRPVAPPAFIFDEGPRREAPVFSKMNPEARRKEEEDLQFLRYKTQGASEGGGSWKWLVMVVIFGVVSFVVYRMYYGLGILPAQLSSRPSPAATSPATNAAPEPDGSAVVTSHEDASQPSPKPTATPALAAKAKTPPTTTRGEDRGVVTPATRVARESVSPASSAPASASDGILGGREELAQAERYLSPYSRDSAEAARWLWKAVGKENGRAVLLLSDLYAKGDGVSKSCDQARLLLMVAAKKGNAEAASRLRGLNAGGCQ